MKKVFFYTPGLAVILCISMLAISSDVRPAADEYPSGLKDSGVVLMELFTSQGCSSCPPADAIAGMYAAKNDAHIIPIVFHVDYWNRLGWIDSFSNSIYSQRQQDYAARFSPGSVYTPQMIINGKRQLVGSDKENIEHIVNEMLREPGSAKIILSTAKIDGNKVSVSYTIKNPYPGTSINAALVQKNAVTHIKAGENRGLKLTNCNVVRDFRTKELKTEVGEFLLQLPDGNNASGYFVVLFVQDDATGFVKTAVKENCR